MEEFMTASFWLAVGQIIMIDILLGGDNAVVIALACRNLPPKQRTQGIIYGTMGAIVLRVILIAFALALLAVPYLKTGGRRVAAVDWHQAVATRRRGCAQHQLQRQALGCCQNRDHCRPGDERGQRAGDCRCGTGRGAAASVAAGDFRSAGEHSHHRLGQPDCAQTDGALSRWSSRWARCCLAGLPARWLTPTRPSRRICPPPPCGVMPPRPLAPCWCWLPARSCRRGTRQDQPARLKGARRQLCGCCATRCLPICNTGLQTGVQKSLVPP